MKKRRLARELALEALYRVELTREGADLILADICSREHLPPEVTDFARALVTKTIAELPKIDGVISQTTKNWQIDRLAALDRNILRAAICEILYFPEIPFKVSIDEAIELAKKYSTEESGRFVNGVLDRVVREQNVGADSICE